MRPRRRDRRPTIGDGMILVAAVGVGLWIVDNRHGGIPPKLGVDPDWLDVARIWADAFLVAAAPAWGVLRLRRPRPPIRALLRRGGSCAGFAALAGLGAFLMSGVVNVLSRPPQPYWWSFFPIERLGPVVLGALTAMALDRRRRPGGGWIDGMGLIVGGYWAFWWIIDNAARPLVGYYLPWLV